MQNSGITLHYQWTGNHRDNNPPLLLCHGFSNYHVTWARMAQALEDSFDIVIVDVRGHSYSGKYPNPNIDVAYIDSAGHNVRCDRFAAVRPFACLNKPYFT